MYGNIYQVHIYQMHAWEHLPDAWELLPGTHLQDALIEHLPDMYIHIYHADACMGLNTRYTSTRCMYGNMYR